MLPTLLFILISSTFFAFFGLKNKRNGLLTLSILFLVVFISLILSTGHRSTGNEGEEIVRVIEGTSMDVVKLKKRVLIDAPVYSQFPELERGCEVTSLAMLLNHAGVQTDKLELAEKVTKNPAKYEMKNGTIYFGHPNDGFVGDIYSRKNPGLGVYHQPIAKLAKMYLPETSVLDLTGEPFDQLKIHLSKGRPIWVIINLQYKKLDESMFETWVTPKGNIQITYQEHSVLVTGYDEHFIYFNDPYDGKRKKVPATDFIEAWEQMGSQAITYIPNKN